MTASEKVAILIIVLVEHYNCHNTSFDSDSAMIRKGSNTMVAGRGRSSGQGKVNVGQGQVRVKVG